MNKNIEKMPSGSMHKTISKALLNLKKEGPKKGVDLLSITKKLSSKKFKGKGGMMMGC